ncbi:hypothetical protein VUR80DRAFT_3755 [Thermomyces stellatus]
MEVQYALSAKRVDFFCHKCKGPHATIIIESDKRAAPLGFHCSQARRVRFLQPCRAQLPGYPPSHRSCVQRPPSRLLYLHQPMVGVGARRDQVSLPLISSHCPVVRVREIATSRTPTQSRHPSAPVHGCTSGSVAPREFRIWQVRSLRTPTSPRHRSARSGSSTAVSHLPLGGEPLSACWAKLLTHFRPPKTHIPNLLSFNSPNANFRHPLQMGLQGHSTSHYCAIPGGRAVPGIHADPVPTALEETPPVSSHDSRLIRSELLGGLQASILLGR